MKIVRNLLAVGFALSLLAPVAAQQTEPAKTQVTPPAVTNPAPIQTQPPLDADTTKNPEAPRPDLSTPPPAHYDDNTSATDKVEAEDKAKGDEGVVPTYNKEVDPAGNNQSFPAETYDKKPNPSGDAQKLDAVRYDEQNKDNNGKNPALEMKVIEGEVTE